MKRFFITGSESYVGRQFIRKCRAVGIPYVGIDQVPPSQPDCHLVDLRDPALGDLMIPGGDTVVHLAAISRDRDCAAAVTECFDINVGGTLNLLHTAQKAGSEQFIFASTEWVYDSCRTAAEIDEETPIELDAMTSEYALSKLVSEVNLKQAFQKGSCDTTILRFGIIYGPRLQNWSAVESIANTVRKKTTVQVGSLRTGRKFIHVADIVRAILAVSGLQGFHILNIVGSKLVTLQDIIDSAATHLKKQVAITELDPDNASVRLISGVRAQQTVGFKPQIDIHQGIGTVLRHIEEHQDEE